MTKNKMIALSLCFLLLVSLPFPLTGATKRYEKLFREAKLLIFDEDWEHALEKLEEILEEYPGSPITSQVFFYKAKCLEETPGRETDAIDAYRDYIRTEDRDDSLVEESEVAIIDLAFNLFKKGKKSYLKEIERRLSSRNEVVSYYAAIQLSFVEDKKIARKAVPVLKGILEDRGDNELADRARIALFRIDPDTLEGVKDSSYRKRTMVFHLEVINRWTKDIGFSLNIPWALADLALTALSEEDLESLEVEGYDIKEIVQDLVHYEGKIVELVTEKSIIRIWID